MMRGIAVTRVAHGGPIVDQCRFLAEPIAEELGLELYDVLLLREDGHLVLRFVIDHVDGVTHQHCEQFSKRIDPLLDAADPIPSAFFLEVSSPGAERLLRDEKEMLRFLGYPVRLLMRKSDQEAEDSSSANNDPQDSSPLTIEGLLLSVEDGVLTLEDIDKQCREVSLAKIERANLLLELPAKPRGKSRGNQLGGSKTSGRKKK